MSSSNAIIFTDFHVSLLLKGKQTLLVATLRVLTSYSLQIMTPRPIRSGFHLCLLTQMCCLIHWSPFMNCCRLKCWGNNLNLKSSWNNPFVIFASSTTSFLHFPALSTSPNHPPLQLMVHHLLWQVNDTKFACSSLLLFNLHIQSSPPLPSICFFPLLIE